MCIVIFVAINGLKNCERFSVIEPPHVEFGTKIGYREREIGISFAEISFEEFCNTIRSEEVFLCNATYLTTYRLYSI